MTLIITIIVLLILAVVSIRLVMNGGIIGKAESGTRIYSESEEKEQIQLGYKEYQMAKFTDNNPQLKVEGANVEGTGPWTVTFASGRIYQVELDGTITGGSVANNGSQTSGEGALPTITAGQKAPATSNAQYKSGNYTAVIPAGFTVSNQPGESSIETGLVIKDDAGNEFVWIPVGIPWRGDSSKTIELSRYTFDSNGNPTNQGANTIDSYFTELASSPRGNSEAKTDVTSENGFIAKTNAAGGFWIGRYEARTTSETARSSEKDTLTAVTEKPENSVYNYITQADASTKAREMYSTNNYFESDLINSYAWDTATLFLQEYDNRTSKPKVYSLQKSVNSSLLATGTVSVSEETKKDKICNVYDMADNCLEWTTETSSGIGSPCVYRGGDYFYRNTYTCNRYTDFTNNAFENRSFRPIFYVK